MKKFDFSQMKTLRRSVFDDTVLSACESCDSCQSCQSCQSCNCDRDCAGYGCAQCESGGDYCDTCQGGGCDGD